MTNDAAVTISSLQPPQGNVPRTRKQRQQLIDEAVKYVRDNALVGPLSIPELQSHSEQLLRITGSTDKYRDFVAICINNEVWRETVAGIPFDKRLLLLPKCLRDAEQCPAQFDELGLLCEHCGRCTISEYKSQAEQLGYAVLIAEGSPVVMSLIETGQIEGIVGVSCMPVLERVFPYMEAGAVPGIAVPLLHDGCVNTTVDSDWVWESIYLSSDEQRRRLDLDALRNEVDGWFSHESLTELLGGESEAERLAADWMALAGKRWRPFLAACTHRAMIADDADPHPESLRKAAVAVECFHKASLIHDDIEDDDDIRYGENTMHAEHGIPIALNVGDLLLGEGYRLLSEIDEPAEVRARLLTVAVAGHRDLCVGQGRELSWMARPGYIAVDEVIEIFRKKTSPAFEVALRFGAILAGHDHEVDEILCQFSRALGVAYQIRDDVEDYYGWGDADSIDTMKPSVLMAMAYDAADEGQKQILELAWRKDGDIPANRDRIREVLGVLQVDRPAVHLMESYKSRAIGSLAKLRNSNLKALLRRVVSKIFGDVELMGCCDDHPTGNDRGGETG